MSSPTPSSQTPPSQATSTHTPTPASGPEDTAGPLSRWSRAKGWVTNETTSGLLLMGAALLALLWANTPWREAYHALSAVTVGPHALHLDLSLAGWAADGLLAIFFFVVGLELKHEIVAGSLRNPREAAVPVIAAVGGMLVPALIFTGIVLAAGAEHALSGWAIPTATDIAFAVAILAIFGRGLPRGLRMFLLTLAVVDDLLAIIVIAVVYTSDISLVMLAVSFAFVTLFGLIARSRGPHWALLVPIAFAAWGFMHASGVHATIAGVLMGLTVPAHAVFGELQARTHSFNDAVGPLSSGLALPIFAFFSAGVTLVGGDGPAAVLGEPVVLAIVAGLVIGKLVGVLGTAALVTRLTPLRLPDAIGIRDLLPVGLLAGIGFTVSLLIAELSYPGSDLVDSAKIGVLAATALAAVLAAIMLRWDARKARHADMNEDGVPDTRTERI